MEKPNPLAQFIPKPYKKRRYYTPTDVSVHNTPNDCWISFFNEIMDLTELIQKNIQCKKILKTNKSFKFQKASLCDPIIESAGKDITFWFDKETKEPRQQIDLKTGIEIFYCPRGKYLHIPDEHAKNSIEVAIP